MLRSVFTRFAFAFTNGSAPARRGGASIRSLCCGAGLLLLGACAEGSGEPCQIDSDCSDGLICLRAHGEDRGTCMDPKAIVPDAGKTPDAAEPGLPEDDAGGQDGGQPTDRDAG